jgi:hypothetical protein
MTRLTSSRMASLSVSIGEEAGDRQRAVASIGWARLLPWAAIIAAATLLTLPAVVSAMRTNDSVWIDWVWLDQFAEQLRNGVLYPRWLPQSHAGLGSPVFYYYPPIAFYVAAPFTWVGLSTYGAILAMFFVGYLLSGATMYLWLRGRAPLPLLGAILFVAAPYHAFNFDMRGAMAEFLATAIIPLVMFGLRRLADGEARGLLLTGISYGALICTHLPLVLLASVFLFGPYCLLLAWRDPRTLAKMAFALGAGIALAAIYLIPAFWLAAHRDMASLWALPTLSPANWTIWHPALADPSAMRDVLIIAASLAIPLASLAVRRRSGWAMFGLFCIALAVGIVPTFWNLPVLKSVQFPFRLMPVAEFAFATAVAFVPRRELSLPLSLLPVAITVFVVTAPPLPPGISLNELARTHPDVPENLPPGERPYTWPSRWALNLAVQHHHPIVANGITTDTVFYFPAWEVRCGGAQVPTFPAPETKLLSYRGSGCERTLGTTDPERWGAAISLAALLLLIGGSLAGWRLRREPLRPNGERQEVTR